MPSWEPSAGGAADLLTTETVKLVTAPQMLLIMIPPFSESSVKLCDYFPTLFSFSESHSAVTG